MVEDLLWADPANSRPWKESWFNTERGMSHMFGNDALDDSVTRHDFDLVVRAHEVAEEDCLCVDAPQQPKGLVTIFSAPNDEQVLEH